MSADDVTIEMLGRTGLRFRKGAVVIETGTHANGVVRLAKVFVPR
jgi:hypothetical protein